MPETAIFAAGCFWGVEETFRVLPGVLATEVGYTGGLTERPTYHQVCEGDTQHAEALRVEFDPGQVSYARLLDVFFENHNPTTLNRQGPDVGTQYRSAIFWRDEGQRAAAMEAIARHNPKWGGKIVTQLVPEAPFWRAEEYHQKYFMKQGGGSCHF